MFLFLQFISPPRKTCASDRLKSLFSFYANSILASKSWIILSKRRFVTFSLIYKHNKEAALTCIRLNISQTIKRIRFWRNFVPKYLPQTGVLLTQTRGGATLEENVWKTRADNREGGLAAAKEGDADNWARGASRATPTTNLHDSAKSERKTASDRHRFAMLN